MYLPWNRMLKCKYWTIIVFWFLYRCQKWVENCRRADLEDKTPDQLNKHYRLCAKHFETSMICRTVSNKRVSFSPSLPALPSFLLLCLMNWKCEFKDMPLSCRFKMNTIWTELCLGSFTLLFLMPSFHLAEVIDQKSLGDFGSVCLFKVMLILFGAVSIEPFLSEII